MTIKRRLFLSNILMIVIPLLVGIAAAWVTDVVLSKLEYYSDGRTPRAIGFSNARRDARVLIEKWQKSPDIDRMLEDTRKFNEESGGNPVLTIYRGKEPLSPQASWGKAAELALLTNGGMVATDGTAAFSDLVGDYTAVLTDSDYRLPSPEQRKRSNTIRGAVLLFCVMSVTLLANRFLTQFVFRRVVSSLDTLTYGVGQVRDGNLEYRIEYTEQDEFSDVCSDFNDMAMRLLDSVKARQKDEANRKELIAGISHDLRTPLTSVKAYIEGIEQGLAAAPEARARYIETIKRKTRDLEQIIETLFLFSKLDLGEFPYRMEQVCLSEELSGIVSGVKDEYGRRGLNISPVRGMCAASVKIDSVQLRCAVINILENSVKYKHRESVDMDIEISCDERSVTLSLTDNGPGVPPETLTKLFDVFYRSDASRSDPGRGSGLGLAITAKIIESFGGAIKAELPAGGGLSVIITLPRI